MAELTAGQIRLDSERWTAMVGKRRLQLTHKSFCLLEALLRADGRVLTYEWLVENIWGGGEHMEWPRDSIKTYVRYLRAALATEAKRVVCVREVGYRLERG